MAGILASILGQQILSTPAGNDLVGSVLKPFGQVLAPFGQILGNVGNGISSIGQPLAPQPVAPPLNNQTVGQTAPSVPTGSGPSLPWMEQQQSKQWGPDESRLYHRTPQQPRSEEPNKVATKDYTSIYIAGGAGVLILTVGVILISKSSNNRR